MQDNNFESEKTINEIVELVDKTFDIVELIEFEDRINKLIKKRVNVDNKEKNKIKG